MQLIICPLLAVDVSQAEWQPKAVISLIEDKWTPNLPALRKAGRHFSLDIYDTIDINAKEAISLSQVREMLDFLDTVISANDKILFHCLMGMSRSPAAALATLCTFYPQYSLIELYQWVQAQAPFICPNHLILSHAMDILDRKSEFEDWVDSCERQKPQSLSEAVPFILDTDNLI